MTLKGADFAKNEKLLPASMRPGGRIYIEHPERVAQFIDENTKRWRIVGQCTLCKPPRDLVAEEVLSHRLNHVPERLRSLARDISSLEQADRTELLSLFSHNARIDLPVK